MPYSSSTCPIILLPLLLDKEAHCGTFWPHEIQLHCVSKNDTDVAHYNFNAHQPILVILSRDADVAERVCCQMVLCYPTSPN